MAPSSESGILDRLLPPRADNDYRGPAIALWLFVAITLVTLGRSLVHVFRFDGGAQSIATIPLDAYTPEGAAAVVAIFALWGLSQLLLGIVYLVVLWRYRSLIPLMYLLLIVEYLGRMGLGAWKSIETRETPPGVIGNYVVAALAIAMLILSFHQPETPHPRSRAVPGSGAREG